MLRLTAQVNCKLIFSMTTDRRKHMLDSEATTSLSPEPLCVVSVAAHLILIWLWFLQMMSNKREALSRQNQFEEENLKGVKENELVFFSKR